MPPGSMLSSRRRNSRPCTATGSFARSVLARTTSVTPLAPCVTMAWPLPSTTRWSAGHSPANAEIENAAASAAPICVFIAVLPWVELMGSPAALHRQYGAGDGGGFLHGHELLCRPGREQHVAHDGLLACAWAW